MGAKSKIEWTDASWNPIRARRPASPDAPELRGHYCEILTPGCEHCYAQSFNKRLGTGLPYKRTQRAEVEIFLDEKALTEPLRWRKPRMIFVGSMTDLFGDWVTDEMLDRIFAIMALCSQHTFQVLTKRAERMLDYLLGHDLAQERRDHIAVEALDLRDALGERRWPLPNVWCGVSVEDQRRADRIEALAETPAALRWVSYEPALGGVDFSGYLGMPQGPRWVVIGGESGPGARSFDVQWARSIIAQCRAAAVPVFVKQFGAKPRDSHVPPFLDPHLRHHKGGDPSGWPEDLRVREYPKAGA
jgi:protein gp37